MKCPFLKKITTSYDNALASFWKINSQETIEEFEDCIKEQCMGYQNQSCIKLDGENL